MKIALLAFLSASVAVASPTVSSLTCNAVEYAKDQSVVASQTVNGTPSQLGEFEALISNRDSTVTFDAVASYNGFAGDIFYTVTDTSVTPASVFTMDAPVAFPLTYNYNESSGGIFQVSCQLTLN